MRLMSTARRLSPLLLLLALAACGLSGVSRARVALLPVAVLATTAHDELPKVDRARQAAILREEGAAGRDPAPAIAAYREVRDGRVVPALSAAASAVRAAARAIDAAEAGGGPATYGAAVEAALEAARALEAALAAAGIKLGGAP